MKLNTLPNWLTIGRMAAIPAVILLTISPGRAFGIAAALVFSAAAITDILDGYFARKTGQVSEFGKLIDPIADKMLIATAMIMLVHLQRAPAWMVALIISREFAVSGLRAYATTRGVVIPANFPGKLKTTIQVLAVIGLMVNFPFLGIPFGQLGFILFIAALIITLWSGYVYFRDYVKEAGRQQDSRSAE
ncbi:MAG: CDP-diacylglycerol--glycerol-3-phosphate 3-phosphatidyltransferase [bacterium]